MTSTEHPTELFHYTSACGAIGIVKGSIWATMLHYMNDALEFQLALTLSRDVLLEELASEDPEADYRTVCEEYLDRINRLNIFVFSLSGCGDLLSQWRAYCPPEGGYAVGFDVDALSRVLKPRGFRLVECVYDRPSQLELLRPVIRELIDDARRTESGSGHQLHRMRPGRFSEVGAAIKDPSFEAEKEWRFVSTATPDAIEYRAHRGLVVPYCKLDILAESASPISKVIVGPQSHPELAARAIKDLSRREPQDWPVRVQLSESSFRTL